MKPLIFNIFLLSLVTSMLALTGCGGADTTIIEKDPIAAEDDDHDHDDDEHDHDDDDHDHGDDEHDGGEPNGSASGRLLIINPNDTQADVFDLDDSDLLATLTLDAMPSAVHATGGFRFAALVEREADKVSFVDGGLWEEEHGDHFDLFATTPSMSDSQLNGSRPTHFVPHEGQVAVFFDGDTTTDNNAQVQVFSDHTLEEAEEPAILDLSMPQHGVAEIRGEYLLLSVRRDDAQSTSTNFVLPDQVALYHLHDGEFELEQTFDVACPDLHGAAQNETHIVFGCSDGVLIIADDGNGGFSAQKMANSEDVAEGLRIGALWGHAENAQFIGQASAQGGSELQFFAIDPSESEMLLIDWQPEENALPLARDFSYEGEQFVILDSQGFLSLLEPHEENGHTHWEYDGARLAISEADLSTMPENMNFSMSLAQNGHHAYIADPIAQHVLIVDLELMQEDGEIELDYPPAMITWLGIAESHDH